MYKALAFVRMELLTATSYRINTLLSLVSIVVVTIPIYFIAQAIQPVIADSIQGQGGQYFAFLLVGLLTYRFVIYSLEAFPNAIASGIRTGTLEAIFTTPTSLPTLLVGMMGYGFFWNVARAMIYLVTGWFLGAQFALAQSLTAVAILALIVLSYIPYALLAAALIIAFRTSGPLSTVLMAGSALLGGVYYPTEVIPSWIQHFSAVIPLTYGLRALRTTFLEGLPVAAAAGDLAILATSTAVLLLTGSILLQVALRYARRAGTLAQY